MYVDWLLKCIKINGVQLLYIIIYQVSLFRNGWLTPKKMPIILCLLTYIVSRFWQTAYPKHTKKSLFFVGVPTCPLCGGTGGGHLRMCWSFGYQSVNPFSFRHHYLTVMRWNFFIPKGVRYAYYIPSFLILIYSLSVICGLVIVRPAIAKSKNDFIWRS